jgi:hypothetical protein
MKWIYTIQQKMKVALLLGIILIIVYGNNVMENRNVSELGGSFSSVYEDRLLVESYIYQLSEHLYQKKILLDQCRTTADDNLAPGLATHNQAIQTLIRNFEKTELTQPESEVLHALKSNLGQIADRENAFLRLTTSGEAMQIQSDLDERLQSAFRQLHQLSLIQLAEARRLRDNSKKLVAGFTLFTQVELAMLIVIGIIIQLLIVTARPVKGVTEVNARMN